MTYDGYVYPDWAQALASVLALFSFLALPIYALVQIFHPKGSFSEVSLLQACQVLSKEQQSYSMHRIHTSGPARGGSGIPIYAIFSPWDTNIPENCKKG